MKITNKKLVESINLVRQVAQKQLPVKVSYAISRNTDHLESALKPYDKERQKLIEKYAEHDENGNLAIRPDGISVKFKDDAAKAAWDKDIEELLGIEADVDIRKFKLDDLGDVSFSAAEISAIEYMIEE